MTPSSPASRVSIIVIPGAISCTAGSSHSLPRRGGGTSAGVGRGRGGRRGPGRGRHARWASGPAAPRRRASARSRAGWPAACAAAACRPRAPARRSRASWASAWGGSRGPLDLAFDGADAVDPGGLIVKGAGGALVRERLVAQAAAVWLVLVDEPEDGPAPSTPGGGCPWPRSPSAPRASPGSSPTWRPGAGARPQRRRARRCSTWTSPPGRTGRRSPPAPPRCRGSWTTGSSTSPLDRVLVGRPDGVLVDGGLTAAAATITA